MDDGSMDPTAGWYRRFAEVEAAGQSARYEDWARGVAGDPDILLLLHGLPLPKRQPNLLFACARLVGSPLAPYAEWRTWVIEHWREIAV